MTGVSNEFYYLFVGFVSVLATARLTRLLVVDEFPPVRWLRDKYEDVTDGSGWALLTMCPYCMAPWVGLAVIGSGLAADVYAPEVSGGTDSTAATVWWLFTAWLSLSYLAAVFVAPEADSVSSADEDDI